MCTPRCFPTLLAFAATLPFLAGAARAQCDSAIQANRSDGTLWFQSLPPKRSAGSAQLASVDLGPAMPPNLVGGQQAVWLEWNRTHVYAGFLGGGLSSAEVLDDSTGAPLPMPDLLGAATANGGFILTTSLVTGGLTDIRPCVGSFLWTPSQLFLVAIGGGIDVAEVTFAGASIPDVQGVAVIDSQIFDYDPDPCVVAGHIVGSALAFTPTHVYLVDFDLSGGATSMAFEVLDPAGLPIAKTRGITVSSSGFDFTAFPPPVVHGAAFVWNDAHVYLVTKTPALATTEVLRPSGAPIAASWGVMNIHYGFAAPPFSPLRFTAQVWEQDHAWIAVVDPLLTVLEATLPPGAPADPPLVSDVFVPPAPPTLVLERQASFLYEIFANMLVGGSPIRGVVVGHNQRAP